MFKKSVALLTTSVLAFSIFLPFGVANVKASSNIDIAVEVNKYDENSGPVIVPVIEQSLITSEIDEPSIEPYGVKSKGVIKVAQLLKAGGDKVIDAAKAFNIIDSATAKTFKSNSKKIGKYLEKFENAGDDAANMVRKQLPQWFKDNTRVSPGVAENISIAVAWAIRGADWIFF